MDATRKRTLMLVGGTFAVAVVLLLLLTQIGKPAAKLAGNDDREGGRNPNLPKADTNLVPEDVTDPSKVNAPDIMGGQLPEGPAGMARGFEYESPDEQGRLALRIRGGTTEPLPEGLIRVPRPQAWVYLSQDELLYVTADVAEIAGTELEPESGTLIGNVLMRFFRRPPDSSISIYELDPLKLDPTVEVTTSRVSFDREINRITMAEAFSIRAEEFAMSGVGLTAIYNEVQNRVEHLFIDERRMILYRPSADPPMSDPGESTEDLRVAMNGSGQASGETSDRTMSGRKANVSGSQSRATGAKSTKAAPEDEAAGSTDPLHYYRVVLSKGVTITKGVGRDETSISGDQLAAEFAARSGDLDALLAGANTPSRPFLSSNQPVSAPRSDHASFASILAACVIAIAQSTADEVNSPMDSADTDLSIFPIGSSAEILNDDVRVTGHGPLELRPLDERPQSLLSDHDTFAILEGRPVQLRSIDGTALCSRVEYHQEIDQTRLLPTIGQKVEIALADGGRASSTSPVVINSIDRTVIFEGAGELASAGTSLEDERLTSAQPDENNPRGPGRLDFAGGITASWTESVELHFQPAGGNAKPGAPAEGMGRIKSAEFKGNVRFDHADGYTLQADRLHAEFNDYGGRLDEPTLAVITGNGHVRVYGREGEITGDTMDVTFDLDRATDPVPVIIEFTGNVTASDTKNTLRAKYLRAELLKPSELESLAGEPGAETNDDRVHFITATDNVHFDLEQGAQAFGDRLEAWPRDNHARLTGESVVITKDTMRLVAKAIELKERDGPDGREGLVTIPGGGIMSYLEVDLNEGEDAEGGDSRFRDSEKIWREIRRRLDRPQDQPPADGNDDQQNPPGEAALPEEARRAHAVRIEWSKSMMFNDRTGAGEFVGDVTAESSPVPEEVNWIQADRIRFKLTDVINVPVLVDSTSPNTNFTPPGEREARDPGSPSWADLDALTGKGSGGRQLREMVATSESDTPAKVQANRYKDPERQERESIFYVSGPIIEYSAVTKKLEVSGDGTMFLLDNRPEPSRNQPADKLRAGNDDTVRFSGRGQTSFSWTGGLVLDGANSSMKLTDDVAVHHLPRRTGGDNDQNARPGAESGRLDFKCQSLNATINSTNDEVDVLSMSGHSTGQLERLDAVGNIYAVTGKHAISAQRLHYEKESELAVLEGTREYPVTVSRRGSPNELEAEQLFWNLLTDSVTVRNPGAITVPGTTGGG